ncbi:MAG: hypothetical protein LLG13_18575, partial [Bacteroidales bacterium]|nr:hypothetical protein [Bacteroidales bacterium]
MATSTTSEIKSMLKIKARKLFTLFSFSVLTIVSTFAQPVWNAGPTLVSYPMSFGFTFNLDSNSNVYYALFPGDQSALTPTNNVVKSWGTLTLPAGSIVANDKITYSGIAGTNYTTRIYGELANLTPNYTYTIFVVAEDISTGALTTVSKIIQKTLLCPSIYVETGFNNTDRCVNGDGATKTYTLHTYSGYDGKYSNVLTGATFTISWGDGLPATNYTYTSTYDNDGPGGVLLPGWESLGIQHTYTVHDSCYRKARLTITNPGACASVGAQTETKDVLLAGRDYDPDGNGLQLLVNNADSSPDTIKVCAGNETLIRLRDAGIWDCDQTFKTYPPGEMNSSDRNIQFVYGANPNSLAVENTITGDVAITGTYPGTANTSAGHYTPVINIPTAGMNPITNPHTLSDVITIPATCKAKEKMHVYFKDWNKCNPYSSSANEWDGSAVYDSIVIYVVASPPAPTVANKTICYGDDRTLYVTSTPVGTIRWYSDAALATVVGTSTSFATTNTDPGIYNFWVTDQSSTGIGCMSPSTKVTLTIREDLSQPGAISGPTQVCRNSTSNIFSVTADPPVMTYGGATEYFWTVPSGWTITAGQGTKQITVTANNAVGSQTVSIVNRYTTTPVCTSASQTFTTNLNPIVTVNSSNTKTVCDVTALGYTATSATAGCTFAWTRAVVTGISNAAGSGTTALIDESLDNTTTAPVNVDYIITPSINGCPGTPFTLTVTVNPAGQVNDPTDQVVCNSGATTAINFSTGNTGGTTTYSWTNDNTSINLAANGTGNIASFAAANTTNAQVTATITVTPTFTNNGVGCAGTAQTFTIKVNPSGQVNTPSNQTVCNGNPTTAINFSTNRTDGTTTYSWTNNTTSIGLASSGTGNIDSFTAVNTGTARVTATIVVTPTYTNGSVSCTGPTKTFYIYVNPTGQVNQPADLVVCRGSTAAVAFSTINTGGTRTYAWTNSNTGIGPASGSGNISFTATNTGDSPISGTITVTPTYTNGGVSCPGTSKTFTITVNPLGQVVDPSDQVVCNGDATAAVNFTTTRTGGTTSYAWTNNTTSIGLGASGSGNIPSFTATNSTTSPITATVTVTPTFVNGSKSCAGTAQTFTITVNPTGQVNQPADLYVCNNTTGAVNFATGNSGGSTTYTWTNTNTGIGLPASGSGNISFTATNTGTTPISGTIVVTPTFANGGTSCAGPTKTFKIYVNPTGQVDLPANQAICKGSTASVTFSTNNGGAGVTSYSWTNTNTSIGLGATGSGNISFTTTNTGTAPITGTIVVTPTYTYGGTGCAGPTKTFTITVNPLGQVNAPGDKTVCNNSLTAVSFATNNTGGTTTYSWTNTNTSIGLPATGNGDISFTSTNTTTSPVTGTIVVTPTFTNGGTGCSGSTKTFTITVNPTAVINSALTKTICSNAALGYTATSSTAGCTFAWSRAVVAGISNPAGSGTTASINESLINTNSSDVVVTYVITPTYGTCTGTPSNLLVTVHPQFTLAQLHDNISICNNSAADINAVMAGGTSPFTVNYTKDGAAQAPWTNYVSGTNQSTGNLTTGTYVYALTSVTDNFGCPAQSVGTSITVTVGAELTGATLTGSGDACYGAASTLKSVITGGAPPYKLTITGFPGSPVTGYTSGSDIPLTPPALSVGAHAYTLATVTDACLNSISPAVNYTINIAGIPDITGTVPATQPICSGSAATITLNSTVSSTKFTYTAASVPAAGYSWTSAPAGGSITDANGDKTEALTQTLTHNYNDDVTVTYTITPEGPGITACPGTAITRSVTVHPMPAITAMTSTICSGTAFSVTPVNPANGVVPASTNYTWTNPVIAPAGAITGGSAQAVPQASISQTLTNTTSATATATYTVTPVTASCTGSTFTVTVTVNPTGQVNLPADVYVCKGGTGTVNFTTTNTGLGTVSYSWTNSNTA